MTSMLKTLRLVILAVALFCGYDVKVGSAQQASAVETALKNMDDDLSDPLARWELKGFITEFHAARVEITIADYQKTPEFKTLFFDIYPVFSRRLAKGKFSGIKIGAEDRKRMEAVFNKNYPVFKKFLDAVREQGNKYSFISLKEKEIFKKQLQYSLITYDADKVLWEKAYGWSYYIPFSKGP